METKYRSNRNIVFSCKYHIVWCPKYRRKVLIGDVAERLKALVKEFATEHDVEILEIETDVDHIHILCDVDPQFGVGSFVSQVKGFTSHTLRVEFPHLKKQLPVLWSNSSFISTTGGAPLEMVKKYIENQPRSQRPKSADNFKRLLESL